MRWVGIRAAKVYKQARGRWASSLRPRRRSPWHQSAEGADRARRQRHRVGVVEWVVCGVPSPLEAGSGNHSPKNLCIFYLKWHALVYPERHFSQEMLAGYTDYNTMFCWPWRNAKLQMSQPAVKHSPHGSGTYDTEFTWCCVKLSSYSILHALLALFYYRFTF